MFKKIKYGLLGLLIALILIGIFGPVDKQPVIFVNRATHNLDTEKIAGEFWLRWLYGNPTGEMTLEALVKRKFISDWYGKFMDKPSSVEKIAPFVKEFGINMNEVADTNFNSFNDFFIRKLKPSARPVDTSLMAIVSPGDGKLLAYPDISNANFIIKGVKFNLYGFLQDSTLANEFSGASMYILRLCPTDYHRFHFPLSAEVLYSKKIDGSYYSVSPIALREKIKLMTENKREYTVMKNSYVGKFIMAEVGATMVGSIIQTYKKQIVCKGAEKGYFKFGGSTIVLLFKHGSVTIDKDLIENTAKGYETAVKMGEHIGEIALTYKTK